jgi:hypothetical protein
MREREREREEEGGGRAAEGREGNVSANTGNVFSLTRW